MKLEIFKKKTGVIPQCIEQYYVDSEGKVWRDNGKDFESHHSVIMLEDFLEECPDMTWRMVDE